MKKETLSEYQERTTFMRWQPDQQLFVPHPQVGQKVDENGCYIPFWGDTILAYTDEKAAAALTAAQQALYACGLPLSAPLNPRQFHMTLHDLHHTFGCDRVWDAAWQAAEAILSGLEDGTAVLAPVQAFPMMNTSIVIGYTPSAEEDCRLLMDWCQAFDSIVPVGQPTFHVTLAYFRAGEAGAMDTMRLAQALETVNGMELPRLRVTKRQLMYQRFWHMDHYFHPTAPQDA